MSQELDVLLVELSRPAGIDLQDTVRDAPGQVDRHVHQCDHAVLEQERREFETILFGDVIRDDRLGIPDRVGLRRPFGQADALLADNARLPADEACIRLPLDLDHLGETGAERCGHQATSFRQDFVQIFVIQDKIFELVSGVECLPVLGQLLIVVHG